MPFFYIIQFALINKYRKYQTFALDISKNNKKLPGLQVTVKSILSIP